MKTTLNIHHNFVPLQAQSHDSRFFRSFKRLRNVLYFLALLPVLSTTNSLAGALPDFSALVEAEGNAVVSISVLSKDPMPASRGAPGFDPQQIPEQFRRFFEQLPQNPNPEPRKGTGFGSGFIISDDGYIITNAHVVKNATQIRVGLQDQREFQAILVGSDAASDIALLKLDTANLPVVKIGDSEKLRVGEWVLAIGSPFGFENTATQGIVSALARSLPDDTYVPFIQTDVAVNPGNSGGPLFNTDGEVVGVNSQIYSRSGGYQGLSFSIPINVAMSIADQLKDKGFATRGWLGVAIQNVDQALAKSFGLEKPTGALIAQVTKNSPAEKGGLSSGDIILRFNNKQVNNSSELPPLVGAVAPGESVSVGVIRNGKTKSLSIMIEALDEGRQVSAITPVVPADDSRFGVEVVEIPDQMRKDLGISNGVVVSMIDPDGAAIKAGIRRGDVILSINREAIDSVEQFHALEKNATVNETLPVLVQRNSSRMFLALTLPAANG